MTAKPWGTNLRVKTVKAFEEWSSREESWEQLFRLIVEDRKRLRDACVELKQPYSLVYPFLHDGGVMQKRYEGALAAMADDMQRERLEIADSVRGSSNPVAVAAAKLACEVRGDISSKWGRERYGEAFETQRGPAVVIQVADLRGTTVQLPAARGALPMRDTEEAKTS